LGGLVKPFIREDKKRRCFYNTDHVDIDWEGNFELCCNDYFSKYKIGNILENSIMDIYNSEKARNMRKKLRKGIVISPLCEYCLRSGKC
jgi:GTP 3',8-cyclase